MRNGIYYYRTDIPSDIKHYFNTTEIKQSLKINNSRNVVFDNEIHLQYLGRFVIIQPVVNIKL